MNDLQALMALDPSKHTRESLDAIIAELRAGARAFNLGDRKGGSTKEPKIKDKDALSLSKTLEIDL